MTKIFNIVFTSVVVIMTCSSFVSGASIADNRIESKNDFVKGKGITIADGAAEELDTTIADLTTFEKNLRNENAAELVSLRLETLKTIRFLSENREAVILRLKYESDNGLGLLNLLAEINLSTEQDSEEIAPTPSIHGIEEQLKNSEHMNAVRPSTSEFS